MKRSEVNEAVRRATAFFHLNGWSLPPEPAWDVPDFGLGCFEREGLILVNLAEEAEYCEKLMFAQKNQLTPAHCHPNKKEDIICRNGTLIVQVWPENPYTASPDAQFQVQVSNKMCKVRSGEKVKLKAGERITLIPGVYHAFYPESDGCINGEISTANDDQNDNFFQNSGIGRFSEIEEDEPALVDLISDKWK